MERRKKGEKENRNAEVQEKRNVRNKIKETMEKGKK